MSIFRFPSGGRLCLPTSLDWRTWRHKRQNVQDVELGLAEQTVLDVGFRLSYNQRWVWMAINGIVGSPGDYWLAAWLAKSCENCDFPLSGDPRQCSAIEFFRTAFCDCVWLSAVTHHFFFATAPFRCSAYLSASCKMQFVSTNSVPVLGWALSLNQHAQPWA